jgi:hypothetical protein
VWVALLNLRFAPFQFSSFFWMSALAESYRIKVKMIQPPLQEKREKRKSAMKMQLLFSAAVLAVCFTAIGWTVKGAEKVQVSWNKKVFTL